MKESPLFWPVKLKGKAILVLDETLLPFKKHYIKVNSAKEAVCVIRDMKTRAFGQFLVVMNTFLLVLEKKSKCSTKGLLKELQKTAKMLNESRPTFPFSEVTSIVLWWASQALNENTDVKASLKKKIKEFLKGIYYQRILRVKKISDAIKDKDTILTHCNVSGELAMAAYICRKKGKKIHFFATETRPYFQGAKLTCWELKQMGADVTLVADNAIGTLLNDGLISKVIVGSDRSCANGDIANKIGTFQIAVLAKEFKVPFYVLIQPSKKIKKGQDIPIEIRKSDELLKFNGKRIFQSGVDGFYPGFDVVPRKLISKTFSVNAK